LFVLLEVSDRDLNRATQVFNAKPFSDLKKPEDYNYRAPFWAPGWHLPETPITSVQDAVEGLAIVAADAWKVQ